MNEEDFKKKLNSEQYRILRQKGTEAPFSGKYVEEKAKGMYKCAACGNELFSSDAKFDSGTGWPSFTDAANRKNVELHEDKSNGMSRVEVTCKNCGSHLGHVFDDGPADKGGKRYCINSACLELEEAEEEEDEEEEEKGDGKKSSKGKSVTQAVIVGLATAAVAAAAYSGGYYVSSADNAAALAQAQNVVCPTVETPAMPAPTPKKTSAASPVSAPAAAIGAGTPASTPSDSSAGAPPAADGTAH